MRRTFAAVDRYGVVSINIIEDKNEYMFFAFTENHCHATVIILDPEIVHLDGKTIVSGQGYRYVYTPKFIKLNSKELEYIHPYSVKEKKKFLRKQKGVKGFYLVKTDKVVKTFDQGNVTTIEY